MKRKKKAKKRKVKEHRVYVAGAFSADNVIDVQANMRRGLRLSIRVLKAGHSPFSPWLDLPLGIMTHIPLERIYSYSMAWLEASEAILVVPTKWKQSYGTRKELARAEELKIPIFFKLEKMLAYFRKQDKKERGKK